VTVRQLILRGLVGATLSAALLQLLIDCSIENVACVGLVLASSLGILLYMARTRALEIQPLSTFAIFGFCTTTQLGALLAQTAAWTALRSSLYTPVYTFGVLAFYQAIAITVHATYCLFTTPSAKVTPLRSLLDGMGLYRTPSAGASWVMGIVGLSAFPFANGPGIFNKICSAFIFLTWAPFLLPVYRIADPGRSRGPLTSAVLLTAYALLVCLLGMAVNARAVMFLGVVTVALIYLFVGLRSSTIVSRTALVRIAGLALVGLGISAPLADLATAMEIARASRGKIPPLEMIQNTLTLWGRPYALQKYRAAKDAATRTAYDEKYIANPLLARFVETKFHDNSLHFAGLLTTQANKAKLADITLQSMWATLPTPFLDALGIKVDKDKLGFSTGDYVVYLSRGVPLGGRRTGSMIAEGITLLGGPLFSLVYAGMCLLVFAIMDLLTVRPLSGVPTMTPLAMMRLWTLFLYGITAESFGVMCTFYARDVAQMILLYSLVLGIASLLLRRRSTRAGPMSLLRGLEDASH